MSLLHRLALSACLMVAVPMVVADSASREIQWRSWSDALLEEARGDGRLILLDLTASWCTFCKKMDQVTYRDSSVESVIRDHYIAVRISDEDDPELAAHYADYGRPASVVLGDDGQELFRRRGYLEPQLMTWMLQAVADNPDPEAHR